MQRLGFLGAGKMAQAFAKGFIKAGKAEADRIIASCDPHDVQSVKAFKELGSKITFINSQVVKEADVLILAVKPNVVPDVLKDIEPSIRKDNLLLSIAMGTPLKFLQERLPENTRIIRVMPNTPALVQQAASVFTCSPDVMEEDVKYTKELLGSIGICEQVPEYMMDVVTALSGSGPAYIYITIEAMADGAVRMGMPRDLAYKLAAQTVAGAAHMILETEQHPGKLKDDVTSPAGSTAEGLYSLEKCGLRSAFIDAIESATRKCQQISNLS